MKVSVYAATCPQCGYRAVVHSRNRPPGCTCAMMSKKGCNGILGPWMFVAETDTSVEKIEDLGSVTLTLGGDPLFETKPAPPGPTPEGEDLANEIKATAARKLYERNKELDRLNADLHDQIRDRDRQIHNHHAEIDRLTLEIAQLKAKLRTHTAQRDEFRKSNEALALEIDQIRAEKYARDEEIKGLRADIRDRNDMIVQRDERIKQIQWQVTKLQQELDARQGDADHAKAYDAALHDRDLMIEGRDDEIQKLKDEVKEQTTSSDHWQSEFLRVSRLMDEKRDHFDAIINGKDDEITQLSAWVNRQDSEIIKLKSHIDRQDRLLDSATDMMVSAATVVDAATDDAGKFHEKLEQCEAALAEARMQRDYNAKTIDMRTSELDRTRQELTEAIRKLHE